MCVRVRVCASAPVLQRLPFFPSFSLYISFLSLNNQQEKPVVFIDGKHQRRNHFCQKYKRARVCNSGTLAWRNSTLRDFCISIQHSVWQGSGVDR